MRRIAICLLGLTLTLGFVGCGGEEEPAATTPPAGDATGTETPAEPANP